MIIKTSKTLSESCKFLGKSRIDSHNLYTFETFNEFKNENLKPQDFEYVDMMEDGDLEFEKLKKYKKYEFI
jgi:hypothetical protein